MKLSPLSGTLAAAALLAFSAMASAHSSLKSSVPANNSRTAAPTKLELKFSDTVQVKELSVQRKNEAAARPIKPLPEEWGSEFTVPMEPLPAGDYVVTWKVDTDDGHVSSGKISFTVTAPAGEHVHN